MQKGKYELQQEARNIGIKFQNCETKEQLMDRLALHHGKGTNRLRQVPCQLARNVKDISAQQFEAMLGSNRWIAEPKIDGCRAKLHLLSGGNRIDSRHRSVKTYEYNEKTENFPHLTRQLLCGTYHGTILDGEIVMPVETIQDGKTQTEGSLTSTTAVFNSKPDRAIELQEKFGWSRFIAFDIPFFCGVDLRGTLLSRRQQMLRDVVEQLQAHSKFGRDLQILGRYARGIGIRELFSREKEGVMLKDLAAPYTEKEGQRPKYWYKWKKHGTVDAFVTGFVPGQGEFSGLVGAVLVSVLDKGNPVEVAAVQPGDLAFRRSISKPDGDLIDNVRGKVLEVSYQEVTKNKRLRHPTLVKWRPEKSMYGCTRRPGTE